MITPNIQNYNQHSLAVNIEQMERAPAPIHPLSETDRKVGQISLDIFNTRLANLASRLILYAGLGVAATAFLPSVITIPTSALFAAKIISVAAVTLPTITVVTGIVVTLFLIEMIKKQKELKYELSLLYALASNKDWWNPIISEKIVLGAIPLGPHHAERLQKQENIGAVLTILEDFELAEGIAQPISSENWKSRGIEQHHIKAVDFKGVPVQQIQEGVQFLEEQIQAGKKVYVHCKAGRGRSATIVLAYLLKKNYTGKKVDFETAYKEIHAAVKNDRPQINLNRNQKRTLQAYYEQLDS